MRWMVCDVRCAMCDVRCAMCDVRCAMCDVRCAMCVCVCVCVCGMRVRVRDEGGYTFASPFMRMLLTCSARMAAAVVGGVAYTRLYSQQWGSEGGQADGVGRKRRHGQT